MRGGDRSAIEDCDPLGIGRHDQPTCACKPGKATRIGDASASGPGFWRLTQWRNVPGNRANTPLQDEVVANDLGCEFRDQSHEASLCGRMGLKGGVSDSAGSSGAPLWLADGHRNDNDKVLPRCLPRAPSDGVAVKRMGPGVGYGDASLSFFALGNDAGARHGHGGHDDSIDSADPPHAVMRPEPLENNPLNSIAGLGHNNYRQAPFRRSGRRRNFALNARSARRYRQELDWIEHWGNYKTRNVAHLGTGRGMSENLLV